MGGQIEKKRKIAFLYPGQGAQRTGMGAGLYGQSETFGALVAVAEKETGKSYSDLVLGGNPLLHETVYTQPFLAAVEIALTRELEQAGAIPDGAAGLSLGEYSALAAAKALPDTEMIRLCAARGRYMQAAAKEAPGTGMAAVLGLSAGQVRQVIGKMNDVYVANENCPGQIVISGTRTGLSACKPVLEKAGARRIVPLQVSGAFHSPFMEPAARRLRERLGDIAFTRPQIPYIANCTAEPVAEDTDIEGLLVRQICESVLWEQSIGRLLDEQFGIFVEIGPGTTLGTMVRRIARDRKESELSILHVEDRGDVEVVAKQIAQTRQIRKECE